MFKKIAAALATLTLSMTGLFLSASPSMAAPVALTVSRAGWDVVGLDSNKVTDGPNQFPQGVKVCNTSSDTAASSVSVTWNWTSANSYISLDGNSVKTIPTLAASSCTTLWWTVNIVRDSNAYDTSRNYTVDVADGGSATATTGTQLVYVEHLVSQNRNVVSSVTGPTSVTVGDDVTFVLSGSTSTNGYEQVVTAPILDSSIFEVTSITGSYNVGGSISSFYFDACQWDPAGTSKLNWACLATGKAGGSPITVTVHAKVIGAGSATVGGVIYDFSGSSFHYNSDWSSSEMTVTAAAPAPTVTAVSDNGSTNLNTPIEVDVLANDTVTGNDTLDPASVFVTTWPANGSVSVDSTTGKITYTPDPGYTGPDSFLYRVCLVSNPATCDSAAVILLINAGSGGGSSATIDAADDSETTNQDTPVDVDVLANDTVTGSDTIDPASVSITNQPSHGTVTVDLTNGKVTYTPDSGYTGTDSFDYLVCLVSDPTTCDPATVTITINSSGSGGGGTTPPTIDAVDDSESTSVDTPVDIIVLNNDSATDSNADIASLTVTTQPQHGTVTFNPSTGVATYTPAAGYTGTDTFVYKVCTDVDATVCDTATVTITISAAPPGTESNPIKDAAPTSKDTPVTIDPNKLDPNVTDIDPSTVEIVTPPTKGKTTVDPTTGVITYTPPTGFVGSVTFKFRAQSLSQPGVYIYHTVTITVTGPSPETEKSTNNLAETGDHSLMFVMGGFSMVAFGSLVLVRRRSEY